MLADLDILMLSAPPHGSPRTPHASDIGDNIYVHVSSNESHCDIPLACNLSTPSISECSNVFEVPDNGNPPTPNLFKVGNVINYPLNPNAISFVPRNVTHIISNDNINDEDLPYISCKT